ncbi:MAG: iron-sulfur cluster assembly protein [Zestosphaera sp.]
MIEVSSDLRSRVIEALRSVYDPEIPINVWDLGLIYDLRVDDSGDVHVLMSLTAPGCPLAVSLISLVEEVVKGVNGVRKVEVELTFNPPWNPGRMTPEGRELFKSLYGYDIMEYWESMHGSPSAQQ